MASRIRSAFGFPGSGTRRSPAAALLPIMAFVFMVYLVIGLAMPVLPLHVHHDLGFGTFVVGLVAGGPFAAALFLPRSLSRAALCVTACLPGLAAPTGTPAASSPIKILRNGTQPSAKGPADWFTGTVRVDLLFPAQDPSRVSAAPRG